MSIFPIVTAYFTKVKELAKPLVWKKTVPLRFVDMAEKLTICVYGECGAGKSTFLSLVAQIYSEVFKDGAKGEPPAQFKNSKSNRAVTTAVKVTTVGNLTLIDTPGTNDPDNQKRQDRQIQAEVVSTIRTPLTSEEQGISTFVQCIQPDASGRIKNTAIESML